MIDVSDLIGIKYKEHGRDKDGYDCYGLVMEVEKRIGVEIPDYDYEFHDDSLTDSLTRLAISQNKVKQIDQFVDGAMVLFQNIKGMKSHIGVYVGNGNICHCNYRGVHLDTVDSMKNGIAGVYIWRK